MYYDDEYSMLYERNLDECSMMLKYICTSKKYKKRLKENKKIIKKFNNEVHKFGLEGLNDEGI